MILYDISWQYADEPEQNKNETLLKSQIRHFVKTTSAFAKLIRQMQSGDSIDLVDGQGLRRIKVKCYDTEDNGL